MKNIPTPNRIRFEFPTVDHLPSIDAFLVDARAHDYPNKKGGKYQFKDREKALAKAEEIAALVASVQELASELPKTTYEELQTDGICPFELMAKSRALQKTGVNPLHILDNALTRARSSTTQKNLGEAFAAFTSYKSAEGLKPASLTIVLQEVRHFLNALNDDDADLHDITPEQIEDYLTLNAATAGTHNTKRKHITTFFSYCVKRTWLEKNPTLDVLIKEESIEVHILAPARITCLLLATYTELPEPAASSMRA